MHELSIAENIIDIIRQYVPEDELPLVRDVRLAIGAQSGIAPEALDFGYASLIYGTPLGGSALRIELVPYRLRCHGCQEEFVSNDGLVVCPHCGETRCETLAGTDMRVVDITLAEDGS